MMSSKILQLSTSLKEINHDFLVSILLVAKTDSIKLFSYHFPMKLWLGLYLFVLIPRDGALAPYLQTKPIKALNI